MKRVSRTAVWFVIIALLIAVGVERPSRASGLDDSASDSVLATWRIDQTSDMSDEAKIRATVDASGSRASATVLPICTFRYDCVQVP